jgi:hypothetical protein
VERAYVFGMAEKAAKVVEEKGKPERAAMRDGTGNGEAL